jgi:hypothetical protein
VVLVAVMMPKLEIRHFPVVFAAALAVTTAVTASEVEQTHFFHCQIPEVVVLEKGYSLFHVLFSLHFLSMAVDLQHYHLWEIVLVEGKESGRKENCGNQCMNLD